MGKIIACVNEKGGVAKTTTVKNLSVGLATRNKKVLVIDLDPSTNLTISLGLMPDEQQDTIYDVLKLSMECEDIPDGFAVIKQDEGVYIIPGTVKMHKFERELSYADQKEIVLRRYLLSIKDRYDYIFIDCPAGLGLFVTNALYASDSIIIPVQPQFLGMGAMQNLFTEVNKVRKQNGMKNKPGITGIVFTMVRGNTNNDKSFIEYFRDLYDGRINIFKAQIPYSVNFTESDGHGISVFKHKSKSAASVVYDDLVKEFLKNEEAEGDKNEEH